jgi:hypothetical protein
MESDGRFLYQMFKMAVGIICLVLSCEYLYTYCVYEAASFGILYIGDTLAWFLTELILFTEGLQAHHRTLGLKS